MSALPIGTLVNVAAVLAGGTVGLLLGSRFSKDVREIVFQGLGLCTLVIGMKMALTFQNALLVIFSILIGSVIGTLLNLEKYFETLGDRLKKLIKNKNAHFTDGLITATLLYCIGSMAILGAFDEGLRGDPTLLFTKAMLDGFASIALASTYGVGVLFSVVPMFAYQYGLTLFAGLFQDVFSQALINELTAVGGILILGISINLMKIKYLKLSNMLPALVIIVILGKIFL